MNVYIKKKKIKDLPVKYEDVGTLKQIYNDARVRFVICS